MSILCYPMARVLPFLTASLYSRWINLEVGKISKENILMPMDRLMISLKMQKNSHRQTMSAFIKMITNNMFLAQIRKMMMMEMIITALRLFWLRSYKKYRRISKGLRSIRLERLFGFFSLTFPAKCLLNLCMRYILLKLMESSTFFCSRMKGIL